MRRKFKACNSCVKNTSIGVFALALAICLISLSGQKVTNFQTSDKFSLLWEISGNGMQSKSYLYGTVHLYDTTIFKIPKEVYMAIDACDNFGLEVDYEEIDPITMVQKMAINNADSTLDKILAPNVYTEVMKVPNMLLMKEMAKNIKPFFLSSYLLIENPFDMMSVDIELSNYARRHNKSIVGIETIEEQFNMIDKISLADQAKGITDIYNYCQKENIGFLQTGKILFGSLQLAYKNQNFESFEKLENEYKITSNSPISDSAMIAKRNINMADRISDFIEKDKSLFSGIGALHLPDYKNMRGVVTLLKEKGYNLRPILIKL